MLPQSQNLQQAAYDFDWHTNSNEVKQLVRLIIMRSQRPVALQAGLYGDLCLPKFGSVSRCRYTKAQQVMTR
jgi:hypothetical protein